jgi:transposase
MTAPFVLEGAMNGPTFLAYVKQCLVPTLKRGDIVAVDNLPVHRVAGIAEAIKDAGATLVFCRPIRLTSTPSRRPSAIEGASASGSRTYNSRLVAQDRPRC